MPVLVICTNPVCGASLSLPHDQAGQMVACAACGSAFEMVGETRCDEPDTMFGEGSEPHGPPHEGLPAQFGRYRIIRILGQGGMGDVYLAHDDELDRPVALKVPHFGSDSDPDVLERFLREARAVASFRHANFCPIYEVGQVGETHYLAMAFIEGETLASHGGRNHPMPPREAAHIVRQLALALAEAHGEGIIHRDLKPANIMVDGRGALIIMDFGLARRVGTDDSELTRTGVAMGTPHYMSPEQVLGTRHDIGPATDIYALGVIIYELATGQRPFEGTVSAIIGAVLHVEPAPPSVHRPDLDAELEAICLKSMAKRIEDRYTSMDALAGALGAYLDPPALVVPPPSRKRPGVLACCALLLVLLGVAAYVVTDRGTLKVEGFAPGMEIRVDGREVRIEDAGGAIAFRAGEHGLLVTRGEVMVKAPKTFKILRGKETILTLERNDPGPATSPATPTGEARASLQSRAADGEKDASPGPPQIVETRPTPWSPEDAKKAGSMLPSTEFMKAKPTPRDAAIVCRNRGIAWHERGDFDKALAEYHEAIRLDPKYVPAYNYCGLAWEAKGDLARAMAEFDRAIRIDPQYAPAYFNRGIAWKAKGDLDRAIADYGDAIRIDQKNAHAYFNRGIAWEAKGDLAKAMDDYDEAIRLDPESAPAYNNRGIAWQAQGNFARAIDDYGEAIRLDPKDPKAQNNLAWLLAACPEARYRDGKRAVELATKACELFSRKNAVPLNALAAANAEAGNFTAAVRYQEAAIGLAQDDSKDIYRSRLKSYQEKKPFRDASLTSLARSKP